jgi:hypothetical protein
MKDSARASTFPLTMLARMRALDPFRADLLLAGAFLIEALIELAVIVPDDAPHPALAVLLIAVVASALAVRRADLEPRTQRQAAAAADGAVD